MTTPFVAAVDVRGLHARVTIMAGGAPVSDAFGREIGGNAGDATSAVACVRRPDQEVA